MPLNIPGTFRISVGPYTFTFTEEYVHQAREHPLISRYDPGHPLEVVTRYIVAEEVSDFMDGWEISENDIIHEIVQMPVEEVQRLVLLSYRAAQLIGEVEWFTDHTPVAFMPRWLTFEWDVSDHDLEPDPDLDPLSDFGEEEEEDDPDVVFYEE